MNIAFVDGIGGGYDGHSPKSKAKIGGTEFTIINTTELLTSQTEHVIIVFQKRRKHMEKINGVIYAPLKEIFAFPTDVLIGIRPRRLVAKLARKFNSIPCFYWMHDIPNQRLWKYKHKFYTNNCQIIAISDFQTRLIQAAWRGKPWQRQIDRFRKTKEIQQHVIYNPILDHLHPKPEVMIDRNKLLFFSAPDRGLGMILDNFFKLLRYDNEFILHIAHPGYSSLDTFQNQLEHPNIKILGSLSHSKIIEHIRTSLCIFYPQNQKPECFGMVYAEANAVGTPVLAHNFGAAKEVLGENEQLINVDDPKEWIDRVLKWKELRPEIELTQKLREKAVLESWKSLLDEAHLTVT